LLLFAETPGELLDRLSASRGREILKA
jgi:hypothetical protein